MSDKRVYKRIVTPEKLKKVNQNNLKYYQKYLNSNIIKNKEVEKSTYKVYESYFKQFLIFLMDRYDNIDLYSDEYIENAVDIMEYFILYCQNDLGNHKKVINTKISAVSSFYLWSYRRGLITKHPFDKKLERMKDTNNEKILNNYFLTQEEILKVRKELMINNKYDIQHQILWEIAFDSANRIGALSELALSKLDLENNYFYDIREKRGYRVEVIFENTCKELIQEWLEQRKELDNLEVDNLFITCKNGKYQPMAKSTLQNRIKNIGKILGL
jgi:integrase/recombinase XerC